MRRIMRILLFIFFLLLQILGYSQKDRNIYRLTRIIDTIYTSDSSQYIFNLDSIPAEIIERIVYLNDSIANLRKTKNLFHYDKPYKFIANYNEEYNSTDNRRGNLPDRKFIFGLKKSNKLFFYYWHGGLGNHLHLIYYDINNKYSLTSYVTLRNWEIFNKLYYKKKINEISKYKLSTPLVNIFDLKFVYGELYESKDVF